MTHLRPQLAVAAAGGSGISANAFSEAAMTSAEDMSRRCVPTDHR
jgi:hypothetical protein